MDKEEKNEKLAVDEINSGEDSTDKFTNPKFILIVSVVAISIIALIAIIIFSFGKKTNKVTATNNNSNKKVVAQESSLTKQDSRQGDTQAADKLAQNSDEGYHIIKTDLPDEQNPENQNTNENSNFPHRPQLNGNSNFRPNFPQNMNNFQPPSNGQAPPGGPNPNNNGQMQPGGINMPPRNSNTNQNFPQRPNGQLAGGPQQNTNGRPNFPQGQRQGNYPTRNNQPADDTSMNNQPPPDQLSSDDQYQPGENFQQNTNGRFSGNGQNRKGQLNRNNNRGDYPQPPNEDSQGEDLPKDFPKNTNGRPDFSQNGPPNWNSNGNIQRPGNGNFQPGNGSPRNTNGRPDFSKGMPSDGQLPNGSAKDNPNMNSNPEPPTSGQNQPTGGQFSEGDLSQNNDGFQEGNTNEIPNPQGEINTDQTQPENNQVPPQEQNIQRPNFPNNLPRNNQNITSPNQNSQSLNQVQKPKSNTGNFSLSSLFNQILGALISLVSSNNANKNTNSNIILPPRNMNLNRNIAPSNCPSGTFTESSQKGSRQCLPSNLPTNCTRSGGTWNEIIGSSVPVGSYYNRGCANGSPIFYLKNAGAGTENNLYYCDCGLNQCVNSGMGVCTANYGFFGYNQQRQ